MYIIIIHFLTIIIYFNTYYVIVKVFILIVIFYLLMSLLEKSVIEGVLGRNLIGICRYIPKISMSILYYL